MKVNDSPEHYEFLNKHINTITQADNIKFMKELPDNCIDLIFLDPPYNLGVKAQIMKDGKEYHHYDFRLAPGSQKALYKGVVEDWDKFKSHWHYEAYMKCCLKQCNRILRPGGAIWVIGTQHCIYTIGYILQKLGMHFLNDVVWFKRDGRPQWVGTKLSPCHELLLWCCKRGTTGNKYTYNYHTAKELGLAGKTLAGETKQLGTVWHMSVCKGYERLRRDVDVHGNPIGERVHPTQKPILLLDTILKISSRPNDLIFDPFNGVGTTCVSAKKLGRRYMGVDLSADYIEWTYKRLEKTQLELEETALALFDSTEHKNKVYQHRLFPKKKKRRSSK